MKNFYRADQVLESIFKKFGWNQDWEAVFSVWEKVVGKNVLRYARAKEIGPKQLVIEVSNNCVWHQLRLEEKQLVKKINEYFGYPLIRSLKFELKTDK